MNSIRLDDLYMMVSNIYYEQNSLRSPAATYAHFVEVCGMLTIHDRRKKKEGIDTETALCKALGWYFPLLAKMKVRSVEELVFRKYPLVCPYCRHAPHQDSDCKTVRGTKSTVDHDAVKRHYDKNSAYRPKTLNEWQGMFQKIYPRSSDDAGGRSTIGLFEELGELGEAVRVFDRYPKYFAGEAADVFSYIMAIANEHSLRQMQEYEKSFSFEESFLRMYPGLCPQCGFKSCVCPAVPKTTVGRMSKEIDIGVNDDLFQLDSNDLNLKGDATASIVLKKISGDTNLLEKFPFDRGDANHALVTLCLKLAKELESSKPQLADVFSNAALQVSNDSSKAGTQPYQNPEFDSIAAAICNAWRELDSAQKKNIASDTSDLVTDIGVMLSNVRILFVYSSPLDCNAIRVSAELRAIEEAISRSSRKDDMLLISLPASTPDDFRRALLDNKYDIIHFATHSDGSNIMLESVSGKTMPVPLKDISDIIKRHSTAKCVILNACDSAKMLSTAIAPYTIGMDSPVNDDAAIEFSRGFYDAIASNLDIARAVEEGISAIKINGLTVPKIVQLTR